MNAIPLNEIEFHSQSVIDLDGKLFRWQGQIYRALSPQYAAVLEQLLQNGVIQKLVEQELLIETDLTSFLLEGYAAVVSHRTIPFVSYPQEWCAAMLKDAALVTLNLLIEIRPWNLTLKDAIPWNILFDGSKPIHIDLPSIVPQDRTYGWAAYSYFRRFFLNPLILMSQGQERVARWLLWDYDAVLDSDVASIARVADKSAFHRSIATELKSVLQRQLPDSYLSFLKRGFQFLKAYGENRPIRPEDQQKFLEAIKQEVEKIDLSRFQLQSLDSCKQNLPCLEKQEPWDAKQRCVHNLLMSLKPGSVLDVGSGTGWYSKLAASLGSKTIAVDFDSSQVTQLYEDARAQHLSIIPLVMDFTVPTPQRGWFGHWSLAATDRLQCDLVLALAFIHYPIFKRHFSFRHIVEGLSSFAKRWLVVEFTPIEALDLSGIYAERVLAKVSWYTLDHFIKALKAKFASVHIILSDAERGTLLLCEK